MFEISESLAKLIEENNEKLQKFEEWISTQPYIPKNIPRAILMRYLKVCKLDLEKAEKLLDKNVKFKINHQYLFADRNIESEEFRKATKTVQYTVLPKQTKEGFTVESYRIISPNSADFNLKDIVRSFYMIHDMSCVTDPDTNGIVSIYDANGFSFSHFMRFLSQIQTVLHFMQFGQESACVEMQQIHIINCSQIVSKIVSVIKPFLGKELKDNMHFHPNGLESMHKFVDKECLPVELGGCEGRLDDYMEDIITKLHKHKDFVTRNENFFLINEGHLQN